MISKRLHDKIQKQIQYLQRFVDRPWYPLLIGVLAALDNIILVIPNDGILISSAMLAPRRWAILAFFVAVGSALGALLLVALVELKGLPWILELYPWLRESSTWIWMETFFQRYGLLVVFVVAVTPLVQQPAVIVASLANTPILPLTAVIFVGRFIKFLIMAYVGSHAPHLLKKMWGIKDDLKDVGL